MSKLLSIFGLSRPPFSKDLPPSDMFQTEVLEEARRRLKAALEGRSSAVVTGDSGCGKTCLLRALQEDLPPGRYRLHYIHNSTVQRRDFYRQLCLGMGLEPKSTYAALFSAVSQHIEEIAAHHKLRVVLLLDEAHLLPIPVLDHLHILLNFQQDSKPFLSLVLIGLTELRETLKRNVLTSLASRIPTRVHLPPLDADHIKQYVTHRMTTAGCRHEVFANDALLLIAEATRGILRRVDILAEMSLNVASETKSRIIDASVVQKAIHLCAEALL